MVVVVSLGDEDFPARESSMLCSISDQLTRSRFLRMCCLSGLANSEGGARTPSIYLFSEPASSSSAATLTNSLGQLTLS